MIRNIIFDWSGTLVDDLPAVLKASNFVLTQAGKPEMSLEQFRAEFSLPFTKFYDRHTPHVPMPQLEDWFHSQFQRRRRIPWSELPHARDFLEFCRAKKFRTFLLSTVHADHFPCNAASPASTPFSTSLTPMSGTSAKKSTTSSPKTISSRTKRCSSATWSTTSRPPQHGGIHSCAVLTGYNTLEQLRAAKPDLIVEHLGELRGVLEQNDLHLQAGRRNNSRNAHPPLATVGALIFNAKGEVLMIRTHKWSNKWGIPGGKIKWGETSEAALRREIRRKPA